MIQASHAKYCRFPNGPKNHSATLPFRTLYQDLFHPLLANKKQTPGQVNRRKVGPKAINSQSPHEIRRAIIESYISRWRKEVGNDFYPALRLIIPDKDRDRAMYGLKEKIIAKYIIKILKIDKNSEDGYSLLNWKQPGQNAAKKAGDFPGRVHEVLLKRPFRVKPGTMTIEEVNERLDELSTKSKEEDQLSIMELFYREMNPEELKWLVSIILRTMNVGATEKTFLNIWHPDAETLFNISSSLKKVCWELWSPSIRLEKDEGRRLVPGDCFQPQLAQFQPKKMNSIVAKLRVTEEDPDFWIEEKLDGERMQLHLRTLQDQDKPPHKQFDFFSRKAKDYTYLYGSTFDDKKSALTQHLKDAFDEGVESLILDGEMITWDPETDKMVPFGTLKSAALEQSRNPYSAGQRPLYRVFDVLFLNGTDLTMYDLRTRRQALERVVNSVDRRLEILEYSVGRTWDDIEAALRKVVAEASEGLVVKNPRSRYRLNDRNDDWVKVKPEYMEEFGESLDCLVIGGYYGSGRRGGGLSSYMCGLRVDDKKGEGMSQKFLSFFKVGGGFTANDYANIRHHTEGKWIKWDAKNPPTEYIELGGGVQFQRERPDVWIKPEHSVVLQAKAASVGPSDEFAVNLTLRFPRFQRLRSDKDWTSALSLEEFYEVRDSAETRREENKHRAEQDKMKAETRKRHQRVDLRRPLQVVGYTQRSINKASATQQYEDKPTDVFRGLTIFVMTESTEPERKTKLELEEMVRQHGGHIIQTAEAPHREDGTVAEEVVCVASKRSVKVASLVKKGDMPILKPIWLFDCIRQARADVALGLCALPLRPEMDRHIFYSPDDRREIYEIEVDRYGDSFARDTSIEELRQCMDKMKNAFEGTEIDERLIDSIGDTPGWLFRGTVLCFVDLNASANMPGDEGKAGFESSQFENARSIARFAGATLAIGVDESNVTHVVVGDGPRNDDTMRKLRGKIVQRKRLPRLVTTKWLQDSWAEKTRLDEKRFVPV